ncbi:MAG: hydrogenase 2 operon protein HybA [Planctomycetia bacterium]|nr:hydrogenase 2 operon protein HybA [Planctomycetia bacterium]
MSLLSRRRLLRTVGTGLSTAAVGGAAAVAAAPAAAAAPREAPADAVGMLYDATKCIGCKACVAECTKVNDLAPDTELSGGLWQMPADLNPQTKNVIKLYADEATGRTSFVKRQCMHCVDPACVSGCPFNALAKGPQGIVGWDGERCIGCRYCEVSCPFEIPKFEWKQFNPRIVKCELCRHVLARDGQPGCTRVCPTGAVVFGRRDLLLADAKARIATSPGVYHQDRVYGEKEAGGTQVLYLSHVPFEKLGLPTLSERAIPAGTRHGGVLVKFVAFPVVLYGVFLRFFRRNWKVHEAEVARVKAEQGLEEQL